MADTTAREGANAEVLKRFATAEPVLEDVRPAGEIMPGFTRETILTSGPPRLWADYEGGQRNAIIGAALFEGLAKDAAEADALLARGAIRLKGCHDLSAVGSLAGVYSASMPVFAVRNRAAGNLGFCNFYEGTNPRRLNYGIYDEGVRERLQHIATAVAPVLGEAVRRSGGIPLKPIMKRALHMSDDLHSRNTAAALLFMREIMPHFLALAERRRTEVETCVAALTEDHYFFLRLSMAAAKATADSGRDVEGSSIVTAMGFSCREFGIRVSGLGDTWFTGPHPRVQAKLFKGHSEDEIGWMGGESTICETIGLGGFAQAAAFPLQTYQGGDPQAMVTRNLEMYRITAGENPDFHIPFLAYRGTPTGIDIHKVIETGIMPVMNIGIAGRDGGQIGAGIVRAHPACFEAALAAYRRRYP